jgi:hypothetical protein
LHTTAVRGCGDASHLFLGCVKVFFACLRCVGNVIMKCIVCCKPSLPSRHAWACGACRCYALVGEKWILDHFSRLLSDSMYKGHCAECNAHWHSKAFKSRPAGYDLPVASECHLSFVFQSATNNKICGSCNQKNIRLMKRDRDEKEEQKIEEAKMARFLEQKDAIVDNNVEELDVPEMVHVAEKEGTAISVLFHLSLL